MCQRMIKPKVRLRQPPQGRSGSDAVGVGVADRMASIGVVQRLVCRESGEVVPGDRRIDARSDYGITGEPGQFW